MEREIINAIKIVNRKSSELSNAIEYLDSLFVYCGFETKPNVSMCSNGCEIILLHESGIIPIDTAVKIMEKKGYIEPDDLM